MELWTTFCPRKIVWELTFIQTKGKAPSSNWVSNYAFIKESLQILKRYGIDGIRLAVFPFEVTKDGQTYNWSFLEKILSDCEKLHMQVDLCLGPYQYPYYPGIRLPHALLSKINQSVSILDAISEVKSVGLSFLQKQLTRFGKDSRITGFYLGNEWPDYQCVEEKESCRVGISKIFMKEAAQEIKKYTKKPICLNTNIPADHKQTIEETFSQLIQLLNQQCMLGLDIYPSRETWKRTPYLKIPRLLVPYKKRLKQLQQHISPAALFFAEVEAQPWGGGKAWYTMISNEQNPHTSVYFYTKDSLQKTFIGYIPNSIQKVSLWGADFWVSAYAMGIRWPLEVIKTVRP